jgi:hypothetical protein
LTAAYGCGGKTATVPKSANPASAKVTLATVYPENSPTRRPKVVYATNPLSMASCPMKLPLAAQREVHVTVVGTHWAPLEHEEQALRARDDL